MQQHGQADQAGERLEEASRIVDSATQHVRDIMVDLRPPLLDDYGLLAALRWHGEQFAHRYGIDVMVSGDEVQLDSSEAISLFRIAQEALNNIAKHAQASHVEIALEKSAQRLRLTVSDDGIGFPAYSEAAADLKRGGWGLRIMSERAEAIGGKLTIEAAPGKGCRIIVEMDRQP
jgi:signal transduction histidine kinase